MKKRILSLLVVMCMLCAFAPWVKAAEIVQSGSCGANGDNVTWTLDSNGTLTISGNGNMRDFDIRQRYGEPSWYGHRLEIISVVVNAGVTSIGSEAFFQCSNITNVKLPVGIVSIGNQAFGSCDKLQSINIPNTVTDIESWAFSWCENLKSINIPEGIQEISYEAFAHCNSLAVVNIPNNTETICSGAFSYCDSLSTVNIGTGLTIIETDAFTDSKGNLYFNVDSGNQSYCDIDGVLYNKNKTSIISYAKDAAVPDYSISEGVTSIDSGAFHTCFQLKSIRIPKSVTKIDNAFGYCNNLTDVYYEGTEQQWKKIDISNDYDNNTPLLNATIHFASEPTPSPTPAPTQIPLTTIALTKSSTDTKWQFTIYVEQKYANCYVYAAIYDESEKLLAINKVPLQMSVNTTIEVDKSSADKRIKVFVWTDKYQPITKVKSIILNY